MRRLFEHPTDHVTVREAYDVERPRPDGRPWLGVCMVASIDGSTVVDSNSRSLSSKTDQEVLLTLRDIADVLIVGAATVRIEGYGPPRKRGQRVGVVSRRGDVDASTPLFTSGAGFLILPEDAPPTSIDSVRAGTGDVDFAGALAQLDANFVQAEGGAQLNGALSAADVIDELNLTISPQLAGGDGARVTSGSPQLFRKMRLAHVLEEDGFLFTRYLRAR
ncbi:MAG: dihydrofolate reductase family protein [Ilumatobacteraceae bacterium]|nr:dihydrofolate reductase family protein [Ilumatobacteraceae bacterium]